MFFYYWSQGRSFLLQMIFVAAWPCDLLRLAVWSCPAVPSGQERLLDNDGVLALQRRLSQAESQLWTSVWFPTRFDIVPMSSIRYCLFIIFAGCAQSIPSCKGLVLQCFRYFVWFCQKTSNCLAVVEVFEYPTDMNADSVCDFTCAKCRIPRTYSWCFSRLSFLSWLQTPACQQTLFKQLFRYVFRRSGLIPAEHHTLKAKRDLDDRRDTKEKQVIGMSAPRFSACKVAVNSGLLTRVARSEERRTAG